MAQQWQLNKLLACGFQYSVLQNDHIVVYHAGKSYDVGSVDLVCAGEWPALYINQQLSRLQLAESIAEQEKIAKIVKKEIKKVDDEELLERNATRAGEKTADFLLALAGTNASTMDFELKFWGLTRIGKALGFGDTDASDAFRMAALRKFDVYTQANTRQPKVNQTRLLKQVDENDTQTE